MENKELKFALAARFKAGEILAFEPESIHHEGGLTPVTM